jgi:glycosyltransferase involved in cell wall biosynthesis
MPEPLISVAILTYNHLKFFEESIHSIVSQKCTFGFEVIIGDDCSTDGTSELVDKIAAEFPDLIRVLRPKKNIGQQANLISVLNSCRGKYIATIETDDYWIDPLKLQKQVDFLEKNPDFAVCFTNTRIEFFLGNEEPYLLNADLTKDVFTIHDLIGEKEIWFMATASVVFRKTAILPVSNWLYHTKSGDIPLLIMASRSGSIKYLSDVTSVYRKHPWGTSTTDNRKDAVFLKQRILMYSSLNKETGYKFSHLFKKNLGDWYYFLINSNQLKNQYFSRLYYAMVYIYMKYPNVDNLKTVFREHIIPKWVLNIKNGLRRAMS